MVCGVVFGRTARAGFGAGGVSASRLGVVGGRFVVAGVGVLSRFFVVLGRSGVVGGRRAMVLAGIAFFDGGSHE